MKRHKSQKLSHRWGMPMLHHTPPARSTIQHEKKWSLQDRRETELPQKYKNVKCFWLSIIDKGFLVHKKKDWGEGYLDFVFSTVAVEANQDRKSTRSCNYKFLHANYMKKCKWWEGKLRSINHTWGHVPSSKKIQPNTLVVHLDRTTQQSMFIVTLQKTKGDNWLKYRIISLQSQENF